VDFVGTCPTIRNSRFGALVVKDAIVDRVRTRDGDRPSVNLERPDLRIHVRLADGVAAVSLDLAGEPLHRRGAGRSGGAAPLKENLAAAILRRARNRGERPLVDPMCGSGTLVLEAAEIAMDRAPGLARRRWGFDRWRGMERDTWSALIDDARARAAAAGPAPVILGRDLNPGALARAQANVERRGLNEAVRLEVGDISDAAAPEGPPGVLVTNPPYGMRVDRERDSAAEGLPALYSALGDAMKRRFPGWSGWVFAGDKSLAGRIGLRPASRTPLWNGRIECRLLEFPLRAPRPESDGPGWRKD
jgi:23S rRNA (guanine2445-N2)-methyltransferase / 23S rRNA (guanine2069-N7)-methyltransferase